MPTGVYQHRSPSEETKQKIREAHLLSGLKPPVSHYWFGKSREDVSGINHWKWTGNKVTYRAIHQWVILHLGKANHCENCGLNKIPLGMKRYFQWANISGEYKRDLTDWIQFCVKCHKKYDLDKKKGRI